MKYSIIGKVGTLLLVTGIAFAAPAIAEKQAGQGTMNMGSHGEPGAQQMSGLMNDMSSEMKNMSGTIESSSMNTAAMKKMSIRMKQMSGMMNNMSGMMGKNIAMDTGMQKQMDQMRKDMSDSPAMK